MINVGVIGIGHLGSIHLKLLSESKTFKVIGCFDKNKDLKIVTIKLIKFSNIIGGYSLGKLFK